jgi:hypothetical protein
MTHMCHKIHHGPDLGEATTFPLIVFSMPGHIAYTQMSFCLGTPKLGVLKFLKLGLLRLWRLITSCLDLQLLWGLKQSCSPCWELFKNMWCNTFTQVNKGDSQLLMVWSQIGTLTPSPFLGHNFCFKYPNESCDPILNIFFSRSFWWYKGLFNPMSFDSWNFLLKIQESIRIPILKMGAHLGVCGFIPSHFPTFSGTWNMTPGLHFWPTPLQALALVASRRLRLRHWWFKK